MTISLLSHSVSIRASKTSVRVEAESHGTLKVKRAPEDDSIELQVGRVLSDRICSGLSLSINAAEALCHAVAAELDLVVLPRAVAEAALEQAHKHEGVIDSEWGTSDEPTPTKFKDFEEALAKCPKRSTTS